MPLPAMMTIAPGDTACWKLAALLNVTLLGPGRREVNVKVTLKLAEVAVTLIVPALALAVTVVEAWPFVPVGADAGPSDALPVVTWNVTVAPCTGFPLASKTFTTSGAGNAVLMSVVCPSPETA